MAEKTTSNAIYRNKIDLYLKSILNRIMKSNNSKSVHKTPDRHLVGTGVVVFKDNSILRIKPTYGPAKGLWMIPGGNVDAGENFEEVIRREVREETTIEINPVDIISRRIMTREKHF